MGALCACCLTGPSGPSSSISCSPRSRLTPAVRALIGHLAFGFNEDDSMESPSEWIRPPNLAGELPAQLHAKRRRSAAIRDAHGCGREIGNRECFNARKQSAKLARHGFSR